MTICRAILIGIFELLAWRNASSLVFASRS